MNIAIIVAGGKGNRFGGELPKQFVLINGKPLMAYTLEVFNSSKHIDEIAIVSHKDYLSKTRDIVEQYHFNKVSYIIEGGETRQESVYNALKAITAKDDDVVLIHDCARPLVSEKIIKDNIETCQKVNAATTAIKATDTTIIASDEKMKETLNRDVLFQVQTPQTFRYKLIKDAHDNCKDHKATDDAQLVRNLGHEVAIVNGSKNNIKITTQEDLMLFTSLLKEKKA